MERIYLDHNATSSLRPEAREAILMACSHHGNPNSIHASGRFLRKAIDDAREWVAKLVGGNPGEVIFTSGGTEANHLAWQAFQKENKSIFTANVEHSCVLAAAQKAQVRHANVTYAKANRRGDIDLSSLDEASFDFISLQLANNETGIVHPVLSLKKNKAILHTDAVQWVGKRETLLHHSNLDMLSLSGHKLGAPQGIGALVVKRRTELNSIWDGGPQEKGRRPGTENVLGIVGLGAAAQALMNSRETEAKRIEKLRDQFESALLEKISDCTITGKEKERIPNTAHVFFAGADAESVVIAADLMGIDCSTGAACSAGSIEPSHVLLAMGFTKQEAKCCVRFSLGWSTTEQEIAKVVECLPKIVDQVRKKGSR